ncbi:MAG: hypothetical protein E2O39_16725 [Planctomycetota bacterium]|nr:MAG: hypothetical protein E2O39_16725 [Planctomycetota bacterium]
MGVVVDHGPGRWSDSDRRVDTGRDPRAGGQIPFSHRAVDDAFVRLTSRGETQAARKLASRHVARLRGYLNAVHGTALGGPEAVEELIAETIERALGAETYRPDRGGIDFWLFTLGRDLALDRIRSGRKPVTPSLSPEEVLAEFCRARDEPPGASAGTPARKPRWQKDELAILRAMYPRASNIAIARELQRSVKSVVSKAHFLRLKKDPARLSEMGRQNVSLRGDRRKREE